LKNETARVSEQKTKVKPGGNYPVGKREEHAEDEAEEERRSAMSKPSQRSQRIALILLGLVMALVAIAQHFGWLSGPPALLAPGIE
jgi:hypothetical protein